MNLHMKNMLRELANIGIKNKFLYATNNINVNYRFKKYHIKLINFEITHTRNFIKHIKIKY